MFGIFFVFYFRFLWTKFVYFFVMGYCSAAVYSDKVYFIDIEGCVKRYNEGKVISIDAEGDIPGVISLEMSGDILIVLDVHRNVWFSYVGKLSDIVSPLRKIEEINDVSSIHAHLSSTFYVLDNSGTLFSISIEDIWNTRVSPKIRTVHGIPKLTKFSFAYRSCGMDFENKIYTWNRFTNVVEVPCAAALDFCVQSESVKVITTDGILWKFSFDDKELIEKKIIFPDFKQELELIRSGQDMTLAIDKNGHLWGWDNSGMAGSGIQSYEPKKIEQVDEICYSIQCGMGSGVVTTKNGNVYIIKKGVHKISGIEVFTGYSSQKSARK